MFLSSTQNERLAAGKGDWLFRAHYIRIHISTSSDMIEEEFRYFSLSGDIRVGGPSTWHITDWDQRRTISVTMDGEQEEEDVAIEHLSRHISRIPANVYRIYVSDNGEIISSYTDPKDDQAYNVHYPSLQDAQLPEGIKTIRRDELEELDRLGPDVDLVAYPICSTDSSRKVCTHAHVPYQPSRGIDAVAAGGL